MGSADNLHSYLVGWAKIILPLCALALLSTLFLFARDGAEPAEFTFSEIAEIAREQRVAAPRFSGLTEDGNVVVISAKTARPSGDNPAVVDIDDIVLRMNYVDGGHILVTATQGVLNSETRIARFLGLARLETSDGYEMETNGLTAQLDDGVITSDGLLEIRAPFGDLTAGTVRFQMVRDDSGSQILFTNGVRLLYTP